MTPFCPPHSTACAPGVWGPQCDKPCNCGNSSSCDPKSGACSCPPGLQPPHCLQPCSPGRYGPACQYSCQCHRAPCDPQTGACLCPPERTGPRCVTGGTHTNGAANTGCTGHAGDTRRLRILNAGMESRGQGHGTCSVARCLSNLAQIVDSFFVVVLFFRATDTAYGGSQARGPIRATAAGLHHSHSNARSKPRL